MSAAPLSAGEARSVPTLRAAYSDRTAALMAACCEFAYGANSPDLVADLAAGGLILRALTTRAYLATSADLAVLVFRGTDSLADWGVDLSAERVQMPGAAAGVRVHSGFLRAFQADREAIADAVATYVAPDLGLYITGHSLGGALAQLAAALLDRDTLAACYTFGSPRVATLAFDRLVKAPHYRVVNGWDLVPGVPQPWFRGYRHTGDPRLLTGDWQEAYRRDRSPLARIGVDLLGVMGGALSRRLPPVLDHMIWNYRARLDEIAAARATGGAPKGD